MDKTEDISQEMRILREKMRARGFKWTPQREEIAKWVFLNHDHFTVEDILESLKAQDKKIPPATAYRVVQMLRDLEILLEHDFGEGAKYYEHVPGHPHHDHMVCKQCGAIFEFINEKIEELQLKIAEKIGFEIEDHSLVLFGTCKDCQTKNKSK